MSRLPSGERARSFTRKVSVVGKEKSWAPVRSWMQSAADVSWEPRMKVLESGDQAAEVTG